VKYVMAGLLTFGTIALSVPTFGAMVETNNWWLRMTDFPRLQYLVGLVVVLALIAASGSISSKLRITLAAITLAAISYNTVKLLPYLALYGSDKSACKKEQLFSVMVANVKKGNSSADKLIQLVRHRRPDLFLALETDEWWDGKLAVLDDEMSHKALRITGGFFGMHLFSRLPLSNIEIVFPVEQDAPAILTNVQLPSGGELFFIGMHPRPPHPGQSSIGRDAQLMWAAFQAREAKLPALIAGDLNAVPWEVTFERLQRIGGFIDPRETHGYKATFDAQSWWMSWPLDHVLHQRGFVVESFEVLPGFGSDHYPIEAVLCSKASDIQPPQLQEGDIPEAENNISLALRSADEQP